MPAILPKPPMMLPQDFQVMTPQMMTIPNPMPFPQQTIPATSPLNRLTGTTGNLDESRVPIGATIQIASAIKPFGAVSLSHVTGVTTTESVAQSIPYGPGARPTSPRLFGGASFGG